jgi:hypothetical protein
MLLFTITLVQCLGAFPSDSHNSANAITSKGQQSQYVGLGISSLADLSFTAKIGAKKSKTSKTSKTSKRLTETVCRIETDMNTEDWTSAKSDFDIAEKALDTLKENYHQKWEDAAASGGAKM